MSSPTDNPTLEEIHNNICGVAHYDSLENLSALIKTYALEYKQETSQRTMMLQGLLNSCKSLTNRSFPNHPIPNSSDMATAFYKAAFCALSAHKLAKEGTTYANVASMHLKALMPVLHQIPEKFQNPIMKDLNSYQM